MSSVVRSSVKPAASVVSGPFCLQVQSNQHFRYCAATVTWKNIVKGYDVSLEGELFFSIRSSHQDHTSVLFQSVDSLLTTATEYGFIYFHFYSKSLTSRVRFRAFFYRCRSFSRFDHVMKRCTVLFIFCDSNEIFSKKNVFWAIPIKVFYFFLLLGVQASRQSAWRTLPMLLWLDVCWVTKASTTPSYTSMTRTAQVTWTARPTWWPSALTAATPAGRRLWWVLSSSCCSQRVQKHILFLLITSQSNDKSHEFPRVFLVYDRKIHVN